ncbi:MAG TPA: hypothetical protein VN513_06415 [Gemmatimonadales bacterium]|nr:hypothetical protein [Gemmatimonadales bacterium]
MVTDARLAELIAAMTGEGFADFPVNDDLVACLRELQTRREQAAQIRRALVVAQRWLANCMPVTRMDGPTPLPLIAAALELLPSAGETED